MKSITIFSLFVLFTSTLWSKTLVMIGGGTRPESAIKAMLTATYKTRPKVLVLPWGTEDPAGACDSIRAEFLIHSQIDFTCTLPSELSPLIQDQIINADLLYFPGGDQNIIMKHIQDHHLLTTIRQRFLEDLVVGGTSAGTAIQSQPMLTGKGSETTEGLGLSPVIVDQHFLIRNRQERLVDVLTKEKRSGLGIDEGMAVVIDGKEIKVIGPTQVWYYEWPFIDKPIKFNGGSTFRVK